MTPPLGFGGVAAQKHAVNVARGKAVETLQIGLEEFRSQTTGRRRGLAEGATIFKRNSVKIENGCLVSGGADAM